MKIAIIVREKTMQRCTGKGCLSAFKVRKDAFADYDDTVELISFMHEGGDLQHKIENLKKAGVEIVHLSTCMRAKSEIYEKLAEELSSFFKVVGYTHGNIEGKYKKTIILEKNEQVKHPIDVYYK